MTHPLLLCLQRSDDECAELILKKTSENKERYMKKHYVRGRRSVSTSCDSSTPIATGSVILGTVRGFMLGVLLHFLAQCFWHCSKQEMGLHLIYLSSARIISLITVFHYFISDDRGKIPYKIPQGLALVFTWYHQHLTAQR